jgi:hypothetical protein
VDVDHPFQAYFPDRYYAVAVPLTLLVLGVTGISTLIALVMIKAGQGKKTTPSETKKQQ